MSHRARSRLATTKRDDGESDTLNQKETVATTRDAIERALEKMEPLEVRARAMFGEYGLFLDGRFFGVMCDNTVFIKITGRGAKIAGRIAKSEPYPGAKPFFKISEGKLADRRWLNSLIRETVSELAPQKPRARRRA